MEPQNAISYSQTLRGQRRERLRQLPYPVWRCHLRNHDEKAVELEETRTRKYVQNESRFHLVLRQRLQLSQ